MTTRNVELQEFTDRKRAAEGALRDYEFSELLGEDRKAEISACAAAISECSDAISAILASISLEDANIAQWALIVEWAIGKHRKPEEVAQLWIHRYSQNFRNLWESGIKDHASLIANVYRT